ncbi:MAG: esterase [Ktedonobacterales bacterium]|nr:esterase [Ktedonobacterales bacterium]
MQSGNALPQGRVVRARFTSQALAGNPLGDPTERELVVYLPPGYDDATQAERRYPVIFVLTGYMGSGVQFLNWSAFTKTLPQQLDELAARENDSGAVIAVFPDCFTAYGGSQYINSSAVGNYDDYLLELARHVDATYRTHGDGGRGICGHSSGGYGALIGGMRHPEVWNAVGCRSGDMGFDLCYLRDMPALCNASQRTEGDLARLLSEILAKERKSGDDFAALSMLAMAACYAPNPAAQPLPFDIPVDLATCAIIPAVWARWLAHDPLELLDQSAVQAALRSLKLLYFECGRRDEYLLHFGARRLDRKLAALGIPHTYEESDDGHSGTAYRYPLVIAKLAAALAH